jgi:ankyrin repeat protein
MSKSDLYLWDGLTKYTSLYEKIALAREAIFTWAKQGHWAQVADILADDPSFLHVVEPDEPSFNTLLHYAALNNADVNVVEGLVDLDASRTRQNADGQRALDLALERQHTALYEILEPQLKHRIAWEILQPIEQHFQALFISRIARLHEKHAFQLPQLEILLEMDVPQGSFPVVGGWLFKYWLEQKDADVNLLVFSANRFSGGSERVHQVTTEGSTQVAQSYEVFSIFKSTLKNRTS